MDSSAFANRRLTGNLAVIESRVSGEMFIDTNRKHVSVSSIEKRCVAPLLDRRNEWPHLRFYKYVAPTALVVLILAGLILPGTASAQRRAQPATAASIPTPRSVLGFNPGDDRTIADLKQITDYFARLDRASDRVQVQPIGTTTLGRPMIAAFISAPENIRNLEKYKAIQARLADPRTVASDGERDRLVADGKTVVVISCSIHST